MIRLVTGPPGNGKSYYAVRAIAQALEGGKMVATNVELRPDWPEYVSRRSWVRILKFWSRGSWKKKQSRRVVVSHELDELFSIRLRGTGEGRGLMVLDEAHNWMNARSWSSQDRARIIRWFSQHRKLGWDVIVIAQDVGMLDKQVRDLFEYHVKLRNLRRARFIIPLCPVNLFLAVWEWHAATRVVIRREVFPLTWPKNLYDSMQLSHGLEADDEDSGLIWLPRETDEDEQVQVSRLRREAAGPVPCEDEDGRELSDLVDGETVDFDLAELDPTG